MNPIMILSSFLIKDEKNLVLSKIIDQALVSKHFTFKHS